MKRMQCPNCQSWMDQDDVSCSFCGHVLTQSASMSPSIAAKQPNTPPSIIRAAPQPTPPASPQSSPPNLPPPPQVLAVPSPQQAVQFAGKKEKGGNWIKVLLLMGLCLLIAGVVTYFFFLPDAMSIDLPLIEQSPIEIENYLNVSICYLNVSPYESDDWGWDLLGASDIIEPGYAYTIYVVPDQKYDIQVLDCDKNELDTVESVKIGADGYTFSPGSE